MSPLDRKLFRTLFRMKGQVTAIALVIALGVLMLVMMTGGMPMHPALRDAVLRYTGS